MKPDKLIVDDESRISSLVIDEAQQVHDHLPIVGKNGVTSIEAYNEFGQGEYCLWFAIVLGEDVGWRVNGRYVVEVGYAR